MYKKCSEATDGTTNATQSLTSPPPPYTHAHQIKYRKSTIKKTHNIIDR